VTIWSEATENDLKLSGREINFPGDYEVQGIEIRGWAGEGFPKGRVLTSYLINWEEVHLAFLASLPSTTALDAWDGLGVLFLPVGEKSGLAVEEAVRLVKQLEPGYVIVYGSGVKDFSKKYGQDIETMEKLVFKKKDIPEKTTLITFSS